ncbi:heavy metal-binding domain-containing protein [Novosphingobium sp. SG720]|uniref:heavy metal-binding domain-containing protein n=1 Tax=Novosphingobium sp. SG720 TaxID=2586998 RepID=UPI001446CE45|nr:heavy metal-binding domain-containing protein [Novosphingobium sp. SG720]NKJ43689.1 uncharacterized protein YbjQ (UPF0145 family) [Novosphingobium sp. SG720]
MADTCAHCGAKLTQAGIFSAANKLLADGDVRLINFVRGEESLEFCNSCGDPLRQAALDQLVAERDKLKQQIEERVSFFPVMTVGVLPGNNDYLALGLVTANVTVGTGMFNEWSQGFSDLFGAVSQNSGMAFKVNKGEAIARGILVHKALALGGNCVIGVDLDYGITTNNAATINMQGTAVSVPDLKAILGGRAYEMATWISWAWQRGRQINRWMQGNIQPGDQYGTE